MRDQGDQDVKEHLTGPDRRLAFLRFLLFVLRHQFHERGQEEDQGTWLTLGHVDRNRLDGLSDGLANSLPFGIEGACLDEGDAVVSLLLSLPIVELLNEALVLEQAALPKGHDRD